MSAMWVVAALTAFVATTSAVPLAVEPAERAVSMVASVDVSADTMEILSTQSHFGEFELVGSHRRMQAGGTTTLQIGAPTRTVQLGGATPNPIGVYTFVVRESAEEEFVSPVDRIVRTLPSSKPLGPNISDYETC